jgi:small nuclear ribonucleoprotein (snRNP)-like protein
MHEHIKGGALSVLARCVEQRLRVKVWTRNYKHIRGICVGFIVAFDKHWNLAMVDVDETYANPVPPPASKTVKKRIRKKQSKQEETCSSQSETTSGVPLVESQHHSQTNIGHQVADIGQLVVVNSDSATHCSPVDKPTELQNVCYKSRQSLSTSPVESSSELCHRGVLAAESSSVGRYRCYTDSSDTESFPSVGNLDQFESGKTQHGQSSITAVKPTHWSSFRTRMKVGQCRSHETSKFDSLAVTNPLGRHDNLPLIELQSTRTHEPVEYIPVLTRHVNQLFLRGDNVVMVCIVD